MVAGVSVTYSAEAVKTPPKPLLRPFCATAQYGFDDAQIRGSLALGVGSRQAHSLEHWVRIPEAPFPIDLLVSWMRSAIHSWPLTELHTSLINAILPTLNMT